VNLYSKSRAKIYQCRDLVPAIRYYSSQLLDELSFSSTGPIFIWHIVVWGQNVAVFVPRLIFSFLIRFFITNNIMPTQLESNPRHQFILWYTPYKLLALSIASTSTSEFSVLIRFKCPGPFGVWADISGNQLEQVGNAMEHSENATWLWERWVTDRTLAIECEHWVTA
jgi:hypothetical protein